MNPLSSNRGYLILEVLIALAIFSFAIIGLGNLQTKTIQRLTDNRSHMTTLVILKDVQDRIELNAPNASSYAKTKIGSKKLSSGSSITSQDLAEMSKMLFTFKQLMDISVSNNKVKITLYPADNPEDKDQHQSITFELYQPITNDNEGA